MNCSCNANSKINPTTFCLSCVHKHLSTALALEEFISNEIDSIDYRVAAQINLAVLHLSDKVNEYAKEIAYCRDIIYRILKKQEFSEELNNAVRYFWDKSNDRQTSHLTISNGCSIETDCIEFALLKLSIAIELMKYEVSYEDVNYSTAIGQIVNSGWILNRIDKQLGEQCRSLCHDIENKNVEVKMLESFRTYVLNKYIKDSKSVNEKCP